MQTLSRSLSLGRLHDAEPAPAAPALTRGRYSAPAVLQDLAAQADVSFDGERPWDIQVHDPAFYHRVLHAGALGLGESYMDGLWDAEQLDETLTRVLAANADQALDDAGSWRLRIRVALALLRTRLINRQAGRRAFEVGERHYDAGNDLYRLMLDPTMSYSCGYWAAADDLDGAQRAKLELICDKLALSPGQSVLDVGCGWGGFAEAATAPCVDAGPSPKLQPR